MNARPPVLTLARDGVVPLIHSAFQITYLNRGFVIVIRIVPVSPLQVSPPALNYITFDSQQRLVALVATLGDPD